MKMKYLEFNIWKFTRKFTLPILLFAPLLSCGPGEKSHKPARAKPPVDRLLYNGLIYTSNPEQPRAKAILIRGSKIQYAGNLAQARKLAGKKTREIDLQGQVVIPGIVDSHTHPGLIAILGEEGPESRIHGDDHKGVMSWLKKYSGENPFEVLITGGSWPTRAYGPKGPHKKDLDEIVSLRPVLLFDDSGHSFWANSSMLWLLGIDADTPDPSPGLSYFVRDEHGEPTGWIKEFAAIPQLMKYMLPDEDELRKNLLTTLNYLSSTGVTTLYDAGNLLADDEVYSALAALDQQGLLPIKYEGTYHIIFPEQIDKAIAELERLRGEYEGNRLKFNTIKIHFDGVTEIQTAAMIEPYINTGLRGRTLFDEQRLSRFILELNKKNINLHLHVVGDQATRTALGAVEAAIKTAGPLETRITLSHLESVHPSDIPRFKKLGVFANFTPHWFGGYFGDATERLGQERSDNRQMARTFFNAGADVTFSSDVTNSQELGRAAPFLGMQFAVSRKDPGFKGPALPPANEIVSLDQSVAAYTLNGARQLGLEKELGSIEAGKSADILVLEKKPF